ncbi:IS701 family transposase [Hymenobacter lapidarius]|uniref:IS701 family transposase n=1 Tax=Hymenobacter lapidarius TaxID=1908237 RepID=UPI000A7BEA8B|nr:transposase [Hymenobacter lapidarius]
MPTFPREFQAVIIPYSGHFCCRVFAHVQLLLLGAILAPGKRTITSVLRIVGLGQQPAWHKYHRVLSRAKWSARAASRQLLGQLVDTFLPAGPLVFGLDETLERRWGPRIAARGIYRDAVRSSDSHLVKCSGLRWLSVCLLTPLPWAARVWALPVLTLLAPSAGWAKAQGRRHKKSHGLGPASGLPTGPLVARPPAHLLGRQRLRVLTLLAATRAHASWLTRLRLDAALYAPVPERVAGQRGRTRVKGARLPGLAQVAAAASTGWQTLTLPVDARGQTRTVALATGTALWYSAGTVVPIRWVLVRPAGEPLATLQALLSTDLALEAATIVTTYAQRWALEVTFAQVRAHLGVETQRQWSERAIARTTPVLLGLFSLVTLLANRLHARGLLRAQACAWYQKQAPSFSDALAAVRRYLWAETIFDNSPKDTVLLKIPRHQLHIWQEALAWAA